MASKCLSKDDTWQTILAEELMEKCTITPRNLSILKDDHHYCDPNVLMDLRHDKSANRTSQRAREPLSSIMEEARRNLKTEYNEKHFGAMHKKVVDSEVEKFKQHLAKLKRINASSNRLPLARKPLRVRFQRIPIRSRSCGSSVVKPRKNKVAEFKSFDHNNTFNSQDTSNTLFGLPPFKLQWTTGNSSDESLGSDISLPAVYGNSMWETAENQKGPNTTPISFSSGILSRRFHSTETKAEKCSQKEFFENDSIPSSPEPLEEPSGARKGLDKVEPLYNCAEYNQSGDFISHHEKAEGQQTTIQDQEGCSCISSVKIESPINNSSDATNKTEHEKKRKVKNSAYKQFMSFVCNKSIRAKQAENTTSSKVLPKGEDDEKSSQREEKIALVLGYLERKKNSSDSSQSVTPPEPVTKAKTKIVKAPPMVSLDLRTARASGGPFENRFQAQRDLIKKQKMQLEEQQKKIQELTLAKLHEEARSSQKDFQKTIDELGENCTLSIRPQLKTLKGASSLPDFSSAGKIVERMERRAKEREEKKHIAAERRKLLEEERKRKMQEEEENRRKEEEDKKREAFEKIREENIRLREIREKTRKEQERMLELQRRAEEYNKRRLCKTSFRALRQLLIRRDKLLEKAEEYYTSKILKTAFFAWKKWVNCNVAQKLAVADCFYNRILLKNVLNTWKRELTDAVRKRQVADDMYEMRLQERVFRKWSQYVNEQHLEMAEKLATADQYYTWVLLKKTFYRWRQYPKVAHLEREKEQRKMALRQKVRDMLPDFRPVSRD